MQEKQYRLSQATIDRILAITGKSYDPGLRTRTFTLESALQLGLTESELIEVVQIPSGD